MCGSMVDIQSATAEIRRGKKEETAALLHRAAIMNSRKEQICSIFLTLFSHSQTRWIATKPTRHRASTSTRWHFAFGAMLSATKPVHRL